MQKTLISTKTCDNISYLDPNKAAQEFTPGFELKHPKRQAKGVIIRVQTARQNIYYFLCEI
jgi:hypothetical protein